MKATSVWGTGTSVIRHCTPLLPLTKHKYIVYPPLHMYNENNSRLSVFIMNFHPQASSFNEKKCCVISCLLIVHLKMFKVYKNIHSFTNIACFYRTPTSSHKGMYRLFKPALHNHKCFILSLIFYLHNCTTHTSYFNH